MGSKFVYDASVSEHASAEAMSGAYHGLGLARRPPGASRDKKVIHTLFRSCLEGRGAYWSARCSCCMTLPERKMLQQSRLQLRSSA